MLDNSKKQFIDKLDQDKLIIYNHTQLAKLDKGYDKMFDNNKCKFWARKLKSDFKKRFDDCFFELNKKAIFLIGDSHQMDFYNGLAKISSEDLFIVSISRGRCRLNNPRPLGYDGCDFDNLKNFINENQEKIEIIIYHQSGSFFLQGSKSLPIKEKDIIKVIEYLENLDVEKITWLGPRIEPNIPIDYTYTQNYQKHKNFINYNIKYVDKEIAEKTSNSSIDYISINKIIDFNLKKDFFVEESFTFSDYDHWSSFGELYFTKKILENSNLLK